MQDSKTSIVPISEAEEYMIGISTKDTEEKRAHIAQQSRYTRRVEFW